MTDTQKAIEALGRINSLIDGYNLNGLHNGRLKDIETIRRALKLAEAVEKDLAEGRVMCERKAHLPEHDGATGYFYYVLAQSHISALEE